LQGAQGKSNMLESASGRLASITAALL